MLAFRLNPTTNYKPTGSAVKPGIITKYLEYCESQQNMKVYWYMKAIILITCVYMVPSIIAMAMATDLYVYYVGFTMVLFYTNVLAHITNLSSKYYVPIYHLTCLIMVLAPLLTILMNGLNGTLVVI